MKKEFTKTGKGGRKVFDHAPLLLALLRGAFYSINMLPPLWQNVTLFNPVVYLISGFRWRLYGVADVHIAVSTGMSLGFMALCLMLVWWLFRSGYKLRR